MAFNSTNGLPGDFVTCRCEENRESDRELESWPYALHLSEFLVAVAFVVAVAGNKPPLPWPRIATKREAARSCGKIAPQPT